MPLRICVLGNTLREAHRLLDLLVFENKDQVSHIKNRTAYFKDGTTFTPCSATCPDFMQGFRFDQVFCGEIRAEEMTSKEYIRYLCTLGALRRATDRSCVPKEFIWQYLSF